MSQTIRPGTLRRARGILLAALAACTVSERPTSPPRLAVQSVNLVGNAGFESGAAPWLRIGNAGRTLVATNPHSGAVTLQVAAYVTYERAVFQDVTVSGGTSYDVGAWASTSG